MKKLVLILCLVVGGCDGPQYANVICLERETMSGRCTREELRCPAPLELYGYYGAGACRVPPFMQHIGTAP